MKSYLICSMWAIQIINAHDIDEALRRSADNGTVLFIQQLEREFADTIIYHNE